MSTTREMLYHLVPAADWDACKTGGKAYFPPTYESDGFIHLTKEANLLLPVANHFYKDVKGVVPSRHGHRVTLSLQAAAM